MVLYALNFTHSSLRRFATAALAFVCAMVLALPATALHPAMAAAVEEDSGEVAIVFTNDVHCGISDGLGYAGVAAFVDEAEEAFGADNVTLVDAGDAIQGDALGTLTNGGAIIDFITDNLSGVVGEEYANPEGSGRIVFSDGPNEDGKDDSSAGNPGEDEGIVSTVDGDSGTGESELPTKLVQTNDGATLITAVASVVALVAGGVVVVATVRLRTSRNWAYMG